MNEKQVVVSKEEPLKTSRQFIVGITANLVSVAVGTTIGWQSPVQPKLEHPELGDTPLSGIPSDSELAWMASLLSLGALIAPFIAAPMADRIGRKPTLLCSSVILIVSYILMVTTNNMPQILAGRVVQGLGIGFLMSVQPMYLGEIGTDEYRGALQTLMGLGFVTNLASVAVGTTIGWQSPVQPKLEHPELGDTPLSGTPSDSELAWMSSLLSLGALVAPFIAAPLADRIGRKFTLLFSAVIFIVSYILLVTTNNMPQIMAGRVVQGLGIGFVMSVQPMYVGEIGTDEYRGALGSLMQLFIVLGILYSYAIGPYVLYNSLQYYCLAIPIIFAVLFFFCPDSPFYLIAKGNRAGAVKALRVLRGRSEDGVQSEFLTIEQDVEQTINNKGTIMDLFRSSSNFKALIICVGLVAGQQLAGINAVLFNSQKIFDEAGGTLSPAISTIIIGVVNVLASSVTPFVVDRMGRKPLLLFSAAGMAVGHAALGTYFYLDAHDSADNVRLLPVISLIVFVAVYCVGYGPLPFAVLGELFPSEVKAPASSIVTSVCWLLSFIITMWFASLQEAIGSDWSFWLFGIFCVASFIFVLLVLFETKGLSFKEIQEKLK